MIRSHRAFFMHLIKQNPNAANIEVFVSNPQNALEDQNINEF